MIPDSGSASEVKRFANPDWVLGFANVEPDRISKLIGLNVLLRGGSDVKAV